MAKKQFVENVTVTNETEIQEYTPIRIKVKDLKFDPENPNIMSPAEEAGLKDSFETFGNVQPIVIDQNNMIVHGNHRAKVLSEMGAKEIITFKRVFKDDDERRQFSQTMNKLHGTYDKVKDAEQLTKLFEKNKLGKLANLLGQKESSLVEFMNLFSKEQEDKKMEGLDLKNKNLNLLDDPELVLKFQMKTKEEYIEVVTKLRYLDEDNKENALLKLVRGK